MRKISANENVMTTREAGETLGVAVRTIQLWVEAGILPAWRTAGGHRRISRLAVEKLLAERANDLMPPVYTAPVVPRSLKVLLVEDDPHLTRLFRGVVASWGFPVELTTAGNGFEGLLRIGETRPDVLIVDLVMPGMDGFEMLRALTGHIPGLSALKMLVCSVLSSEEIAARGGIPEGVVCFQKPLDYSKLEALVYQYFSETQLRATAH